MYNPSIELHIAETPVYVAKSKGRDCSDPQHNQLLQAARSGPWIISQKQKLKQTSKVVS